MRILTIAWVTIAIITTTSGCAKPSLYKSWGEKLVHAPEASQTKEDISLMLGAEPYKCDNVPAAPMIGIRLEGASGTTVRGINPNDSVANTDIKIGDKILSINSKPTKSPQDVVAAIKAVTDPNRPIIIETQRSSYAITPRYLEVKQCYWEITAGKVERHGGSAYVNQYGGAAAQGGAAYNRFFRATCRFVDGKASNCQSNWQE